MRTQLGLALLVAALASIGSQRDGLRIVLESDQDWPDPVRVLLCRTSPAGSEYSFWSGSARIGEELELGALADLVEVPLRDDEDVRVVLAHPGARQHAQVLSPIDRSGRVAVAVPQLGTLDVRVELPGGLAGGGWLVLEEDGANFIEDLDHFGRCAVAVVVGTKLTVHAGAGTAMRIETVEVEGPRAPGELVERVIQLGEYARAFSGRVVDSEGEPVASRVLDVWLTDAVVEPALRRRGARTLLTATVSTRGDRIVTDDGGRFLYTDQQGLLDGATMSMTVRDGDARASTGPLAFGDALVFDVGPLVLAVRD